MKGFSVRNLKYTQQWFQFWSAETAIGQQLVAQIPWGHNLVIIGKIKNVQEAIFYVQKTIQNNCSRAVLTHQIEGQELLQLAQQTHKYSCYIQDDQPEPLNRSS